MAAAVRGNSYIIGVGGGSSDQGGGKAGGMEVRLACRAADVLLARTRLLEL